MIRPLSGKTGIEGLRCTNFPDVGRSGGRGAERQPGKRATGRARAPGEERSGRQAMSGRQATSAGKTVPRAAEKLRWVQPADHPARLVRAAPATPPRTEGRMPPPRLLAQAT